MLFQIPIFGYTNGRISANVVVPFQGRYRIKLVNYWLYYNNATHIVFQVNSQSLFNNIPNSRLYLSSHPGYTAVYTDNKFEFESVLNGIMDLDLVDATTGSPPALNFTNAIFSFDIEKIDDLI
jgi:hypothetical protein